MAVAAMRGMIKLSYESDSPSLIVSDSASIPKNEPTNAEKGSMNINEKINATTKPQIEPKRLLYFLNGFSLYLEPK